MLEFAVMRPDVIDFGEFYASPLGQVACRLIRRRIRTIWPQVTGLKLLGLGYATPYLLPFLAEAERVVALMPAAQGVIHWPRGEPGLVALSDEAELPLEDSSIDRILMVHALETSEQVRPMLREVWRLLSPSGRLIVVVPNRRGIWARVERTPFGYGFPFSPRQLNRLLRETMFSPELTARALYLPPTRRRTLIRAASAFENLGARWGQVFSGVLAVEASKQIYALTATRRVPASRRHATVLVPGAARRSGTPAAASGG
jgi:SAM-dependent methyltransferase